MSEITKEQIEHLARLARIELNPEIETRLANDLGKILDHFTELQELPPRAQGMLKAQKDPLRDDSIDLPNNFTDSEKIIKQFPSKQNDQLKIPPVFE
ncbi:MAG: Asp-tRNA(Asn)/Glu-tRNA(Gln) amidotransferase GatCAB subunit C [Candidatus Harrisonbacteria bacterium CG10_big_fil_rev_8_21_14_0_10_45_28]|uniref:Asp-tRNA(Asn)/Glu-tRNA(Gln) amidotransferase GatCAB subunit C n=1 Tax=Candidatus Harrisonbacteria bacterium CG10_big_fil_rev_8_21_14_0_10_45_28 TaxID=1974586 RepID=A0A2H0UNP9_9BACT|nr:MAG: Asp-tRNA(Asn)/Glu-tRNA(Gln) amidotransferase GatCAB subunit C [Candidatus Harrisonbacteria bacterium CG10_big_fil_rev_8_21_14_0_10_45_28]